MSSNQYTRALEDAKRADDLEPNNKKTLLRLARIYTALGRPKEALAIFDDLNLPYAAPERRPAKLMNDYIDQASQNIKGNAGGSMILYAIEQAEKQLGANVERPRQWTLMKGEAQLKMGNENALGEAHNIAMTLLRKNQQDPEACILRGRAFYMQGDNENASKYLRMAINLDPDNKPAIQWHRIVGTLNTLKEEGNRFYKENNMTRAIKCYEQALEIDPKNKLTNAKLYQNRAQCYLRVCSKST